MTSPTTATHYTTEDYKRYVYAGGRAYIERIIQIIVAPRDPWPRLRERRGPHRAARQRHQSREPGGVRRQRDQSLRKDVDTYSDGQPVTTFVQYGERDEYIEHTWHPDPAHPDNQVGAWVEYSFGSAPFRHIRVTGRGTFEVYKEEDIRRGRAMSKILAALVLAVGGLVATAGPAAADYRCPTERMSSGTWVFYCDGSYPRRHLVAHGHDLLPRHRVHHPRKIRQKMTNTAKKSKIKDLDEDQQAIYKLIMGCHGFLPTWTQISQKLQISKQRIGAAMRELEARGLLDHAMPDLTPDDQRHVLYTLPPREDGWGITHEEVAEQVGMDVQTVEECMRVLDEKGWICDPDEKTREEG